MDAGGWNLAPVRTAVGLVGARPARVWHGTQKLDVEWQLEHFGWSKRAATGCIESQSFGCTSRGRVLPSWQSAHCCSAWQLEQNPESDPATRLWRSIQSAP